MIDEFDQLIDDLVFDEIDDDIQEYNSFKAEKTGFDEFIKSFFEKITRSIDIEATLNIILDTIHDYLEADSSFITDSENNIIMDRNMFSKNNDDISILKKDNILAWVKKEGKQTVYQVDDSYYVVAPLIVESEFEGFLVLVFKDFEITPKISNIINITSNILAVFFAKKKIYKQLIEKSDNLEIKMSETKDLYDELLIVYEFVKKVSTIFDEKDLFKILQEMSIRAFGVEKAFIFKYDRSNHHLELIISTDNKKTGRNYPVFDFFHNFDNSNEIINQKEIEEENLSKQFGINSAFAAPLMYNEKLYAVILLGERKTNKPYSEQDEKIFSSLVQQAGFSLQNIALYNQYVEKQKIERDLELARDIQISLLPKNPPVINDYDIVATSLPAKQVGGDYYDFYKLSENSFWTILGDVSGKGIAAAILMSMVRSMLKVEIKNCSEAGELLTNLNNLVAGDIYEGKFITFFACYFDCLKNKMYFSNAGHLPTIIYKAKEKKIIEFEADALPIGIMEGVKYPNRSVKIEKDDIIILYTDGINEAMNNEREEYGFERFHDIIIKNAKNTAPIIHRNILKSIEEFTENAPQHDDTTLIVIKKNDKKYFKVEKSVEISSDIEEINNFVDNIVKLLEELDIVDDEIFDVKLAFSEILINAAKHGNKYNNDKKIFIDYYISKSKIKLCVEDQGEGFRNSSMPDYESRLLEENGRGIILVTSIVDKLKYNSLGNKVEITKYFRGLSL
ncbi:MAG: SpoIIE family protein phosphatase [Candidatus Muirbacterium halophilum]|nr:SpoIIE family protein phosphatase [Candidatus Muirbacterium halophilum]MCK9475665.1 SpoIIE family protein phosphatase [Candidatus Muirbacterium halophilum]